MPKIMVLDCLSECTTRDEVIEKLDFLLENDPSPELRTEAMRAYMGVRQSFSCGKPLSPEAEYNLNIDQLVLFNEEKRKNN
jgi:hypothetical protein